METETQVEEIQTTQEGGEETAETQGKQGDNTESGEGETREKDNKGELPKGVQKRLDKLTARLHQQEEYVRSLESKLQERQSEKVEAELTEAEKLKREVLKEIRAEESKKAEAERANAEAESRQKAFAERLDEAEKEVQGIREKVMEADDIQIHPDAVDLILESPVGVFIAEHFADNPDEAAKLFKMTDAKRALALARIEARIELKRENAPKKNASVPLDLVTPQSKGTDAKQHKTPDSMSFDEYKAWRQRQGS